ncbi:hypothetical protein COV83_03430 [Candidatus Peregrinibacteria bacterium CG11_big_fil_rev_8_21_14_0_20_49_14]|nr:MAG: hypothetical protein COV83_03430 [Candidatus Peregrinibacteria bacterium CG11_big_fil_rev_8_21_14_0_20_49_14]
MASSAQSTRHWLSIRVRILCVLVFLGGSMLPPYVPKAAMARPEASIAQQQFLLVEEGFLMKSSPLTRQGARRAYAKGIVHTVKEGENLERLARRYDISVDTLRWANELSAGTAIQPGDELLVLPVDGVLHNVSRGQTLLRIAELYNVNAEDIISQNELESSFILAGQELIIPGASPIVRKTVVASADLPPRGISTDVPISPPVGTVPAVQPPPPIPGTVIQTSQEIAAADITYGVLQKPCSSDCFVTQYFHPGHYALDLQEKGGGNVYAAEAGTVIRADYGWNGGYGNVIEVDHGNGLVTLYAHSKELYVQKGQQVRRGALISFMGNTGRVYGATGIHVHFEVRLKGEKKNPMLYIQ